MILLLSEGKIEYICVIRIINYALFVFEKFFQGYFYWILDTHLGYAYYWKIGLFFHSRQLCYIIMIKTLKGQSVKNVYLSVFQSALWTQNGKKCHKYFVYMILDMTSKGWKTWFMIGHIFLLTSYLLGLLLSFLIKENNWSPYG